MAKGPTKKDLEALVKRLKAKVAELKAHNATLTEQLEESGERAAKAVKLAMTGGRKIGPKVTVRPSKPRRPRIPKKPDFGPKIVRGDKRRKPGELAPHKGFADEEG
jgi:hypothetical protein